jgi:acyl-coenzyme A synthetase/AMP-(fatty) acid ligase
MTPIPLQRRAPGRVFNIASVLVDRHVEEGRGERPAIRLLHGRTVTYRELSSEANRAGQVLRRAGVDVEQRVALLLPDGLAFVAAFLGALRIGAVPVPLNTSAPLDDLAFFLADSRARVLVTTPEPARTILDGQADRRAAPAELRTVFVVDSGDAVRRASAQPVVADWDAALAAVSDDLWTLPTGVDEPCYWLYSSGTTGRPKATVHLHGDMLACVVPYAEDVLGMTPDDVTFSVARLFFSYGLVNSLFLPLLAGASTVLTPHRPDPAHVLDVVGRHAPTLLFGVPTSYAQLCARLESVPPGPPAGDENTPSQRERAGGGGPSAQGTSPFGCLRLGVSAGEPLPAPLYHRWLRLTGVELLDGLGSTEVGYIFCSNRPGHVRPGSSGQLFGDHRARIVDELGRDAADGEPGELWVAAESTALCYWNQRARTKATFVGEWLRTGDRYVRDADGYFWYQGRVGDVFKVSGQWVSPLEVESCLLDHPAVAECAVVAAVDEDGLVKPRAFVVARPGRSVDARELQQHVKDRLLPHTYPRWVVFVDELPKTATGKVQRYKLRDDEESA